MDEEMDTGALLREWKQKAARKQLVAKVCTLVFVFGVLFGAFLLRWSLFGSLACVFMRCTVDGRVVW